VAGLGRAITGSVASAPAHVVINERNLNPLASTYASEHVRCTIDGRNLRLFCKYGVGRVKNDRPDRLKLCYEIDIYRRVLVPLGVSTPSYYGALTDQVPCWPWLILEDLEDAERISVVECGDAMPEAARWLARFHTLLQDCVSKPELDFVQRLSSEHYRTVATFADRQAPSVPEHPWLAPLVKQYLKLTPLLDSEPTLTHGEFYPENVLFQSGAVRPLDWQRARVAAGEIDLAMLVDRWPQATVARLSELYRRTRWKDSGPEDFASRFLAARLYVHFRWLSRSPDWIRDPSVKWRVTRLRSEARHLGLLNGH
jgi:aminoglycoside phosphotransferase (APT) family kinase protein